MLWGIVSVLGVIAFLVAVFYRLVRAASPPKLDELNALAGKHYSLPDLTDAVVALSWLKVCSYAAFAVSVALAAVAPVGPGFTGYALAGIVSVAVLLAGEALALVVGEYQSGKLLYALVPLVSLFASAGGKILLSAHFLADIIARIAGREPPGGRQAAAEKDILDAVWEGGKEGVIKTQEIRMIESIIDFKDIQVSTIMTPRTEMITIDAGGKVTAALQTAITSGHTRLPVHAESADDIVGVLYVKDILPLVGLPEALAVPVRDIMRPPHFVPETKTIRELLQEFRATNVHVAIVLDEYGGTSGLVTIEDILEQIVGDIEAEYQILPQPDVRIVSAGKAVVEGQAALKDVNNALGTALEECDDYETVAGFVLFRVERIPAVGEVFDIGSVRFAVLDADARRIKRMSVEYAGKGQPQAGAPGK